jgi:hypothetical protein
MMKWLIKWFMTAFAGAAMDFLRQWVDDSKRDAALIKKGEDRIRAENQADALEASRINAEIHRDLSGMSLDDKRNRLRDYGRPDAPTG